MASEQLQKGNSLFVDEAYEEALQCYNKAIDLDDKNVEAYIKRSACQHKLSNDIEAVADATTAIKLAPENPKAYLRKGMASFAMGEWQTAKDAFERLKSLEDNKTQADRWIRKCQAEIEAEEDEEEEEEEEDTTDVPKKEKEENKVVEEPIKEEKGDEGTPIVEHPPKVRWQWYQSVSSVYVSVFLKNKKKEDINVDFEEERCIIKAVLDDGDNWELELLPFSKILPNKSYVDIGKVKVEVVLRKAEDAQWDDLQKKEGGKVRPWADESTMNKHVYPSSSKKKVDFDKIEVEEDKLEGDQALNKVFQDIFANASDEQRKAMQKSFLESGGTVLSTNWDEVGKAPVKGTPPKGLEMRKWDE